MAKVLALRTDRLGDIVLASGYLSALANSHEVDLWVSQESAPLADILDPELNLRTVPFTNQLSDSPDPVIQWLKSIRDESYDVIVLSQFTHDYANLLALGWIECQEVCGFANAEFEGNYGWLENEFGPPVRTPINASFTSSVRVDPFIPDRKKYAALAAATGLDPAHPTDQPRLFVNKDSDSSRPAGIGTLVWPGSGALAKQWPVERFTEMLRILPERYPDPITIGGAIAETAVVEACCHAIEADGRSVERWIVTPSDLAATTSAMRRFARVLTNDTGIAHLAAAVGAPVDAVSPAQHEGRFVVDGPESRTVFADIACTRCRGNCIFPDETIWPCLAALDASKVADALAKESSTPIIKLPVSERFPMEDLLAAQRAYSVQRDRTWGELLSRIEGQRRKWQALHEEAEESGRSSVARAKEAEAQRDKLRALLEQAQHQRDETRTVLAQAEAQRDEARVMLADASGQRDQLEALRVDAENQRDLWRGHHDTLQTKLNETSKETVPVRATSERDSVIGKDAAPFISIVTPSFGQAEFIRETIESVAAQVVACEHFVMDGGSKDHTVDILREYPHLEWVSEPDHGQAHAINKGLLRARGDILAYINSDDFYRPGAFEHVAEIFSANPQVGLVVGGCDIVNEASETTGKFLPRYQQFEDLIRYWGWDRWVCIPQPSTFWRRSLLEQVGLFDIDCHMVLDYEMWLRMAQKTQVFTTDRSLAAFRLAPETKTVSRTHEMYCEEFEISKRYWHMLPRKRRLQIEREARNHVGNRLLGVAEHYALNGLGTPPLTRQLIAQASRFAPWITLNPRLGLTLLSSMSGHGQETSARVTHRLHRAYLRLVWYMRQRQASAAPEDTP